MNSFTNIPSVGNVIVLTAGDLPLSANPGDLATTADTAEVYVFDGATWQLRGAGAGAGILTINTLGATAQTLTTGTTGTAPAFSSATATHTLNIPLASGVGVTSGTISKSEYDIFTGKQDPISANNNELIGMISGTLQGLPNIKQNPTSLGLELYHEYDPNNTSINLQQNIYTVDIEPSINSPNDSLNLHNTYANLDNANGGFTFGTNGNALTLFNNQISHQGSGNVGAIAFHNNYFNIGNGTDPITTGGIAYSFGFGNINANVNVTGPIQGYGFQPNFNASSTFTSYVNAFYDTATFNNTDGINSYTSVQLTPTIANVKNNNNYTGININPIISAFTGNANVNLLSIAGTYADMSLSSASPNIINISSSFGNANGLTAINLNFNADEVNSVNGLYFNPTIDLLNQNAWGIFVDTSNITGYAGTQSSLVIQDLTYTFNAAGDNNAYTIEYANDGTAGSETVSLLGQAITVHMQSGVSTAIQIKTAVDATIGLNAAVTVTISGVGSNTQVTAAATNFTGGNNPANIKAAEFIGDVSITGALSFTGALSVGQINAYASQALSDGGGTPSSIHSLITNPTVAANVTVANADLLGVNTAALINIGANATVTTAFLGVSALGLPAVVTMGAGSTLDRVSGAVFAISLDAGGAGTIDQVALCRALALPNGTTTVNRLYGYEVGLPFGSIATDEWGIYVSPTIDNYFAGSLMIGGTAGSDDQVTNSSVGLELDSTTKAVLLSRMTSTQRDALTAIDGMLIYNTTTSKLQAYAGGAWVDLH